MQPAPGPETHARARARVNTRVHVPLPQRDRPSPDPGSLLPASLTHLRPFSPPPDLGRREEDPGRGGREACPPPPRPAFRCGSPGSIPESSRSDCSGLMSTAVIRRGSGCARQGQSMPDLGPKDPPSPPPGRRLRGHVPGLADSLPRGGYLSALPCGDGGGCSHRRWLGEPADEDWKSWQDSAWAAQQLVAELGLKSRSRLVRVIFHHLIHQNTDGGSLCYESGPVARRAYVINHLPCAR
nr:uncharacterized protein LOC115842939 [Globicephala melas]